MAAYLIGSVQRVNDADGFAEYQRLAGPTLEQYVAKVIAYSDKVEVGDGSWSPTAAIVIQFQSMDRLKEWYNSPEYAAVKPKRIEATTSGVIFVEGT